MFFLKKIILLSLVLLFNSFSMGLNRNDINLIFIHGIAGGSEDWKPLVENHISNEFYTMRYNFKGDLIHNYDDKVVSNNIWLISYYTKNTLKESFLGNLSQYTNRLDSILNQITKLTGRSKFVLIAHSMGGLVARNMMVQSPKRWNSIYKILTVGTPHKGVKMSVGITGQFRDLSPKSKFIKELNKKWSLYVSQTDYNKWGVIGSYHSIHHTE